MINAKKELQTMRLKKLIEKLTAYCFVIRFLKGKEMHILDFLFRYPIDSERSIKKLLLLNFKLIKEIKNFEKNAGK